MKKKPFTLMLGYAGTIPFAARVQMVPAAGLAPSSKGLAGYSCPPPRPQTPNQHAEVNPWI